MKILLLSLLIFISSCASDKDKPAEDEIKLKTTSVELPPSYERAQEVLLEMTSQEKLQILKSYMTLKALSSGQINPTESSDLLFTGIPRLGIPSIQLAGGDTISTRAAAPQRGEEVLQLGSVNLIRNSEREQVYGNFPEADKVDALLKPGATMKIGRKNFTKYDLQDLDIFLVQSGSEEEGVKNFVCAIHHKGKEDYLCVEAKFDQTLQELGLSQILPQALEEGNITQSQIDTLVLRMLAFMHELKIIS